MARLNFDFVAFNRGLVSPLALARIDVERTKLSCEVMVNWLPYTQGAMELRGGGKMIGSSFNDLSATWIDFVAQTTDTALLELTPNKLRVWINDQLLTRPGGATAISNGNFATSTSWTDASSHGGTLTFGGSGLILNGVNRGGLAKCQRTITIGAPEVGVEHALAIVVTRGPVTFRCGSTVGGDEYIKEAQLYTGKHSLSFTPTAASYTLTFQSDLDVNRIVASIAADSGTLEIATPWGAGDLKFVRWDQSADVLFLSCLGIRQQRIERRGTGRSWSVVDYLPQNGPFIPGRTAKVKLRPTAYSGNTTLTADGAFFRPEHVGALFRVFGSGQDGSYKLSGDDQWTDVWTVTGISDNTHNVLERDMTFAISGTFSGTLSLQRSYDSPDFGFKTTVSGLTSGGRFDADSNVIVYYRAGFETGDYTSGTAVVGVQYAGGNKEGICRVTGFTSSTQVSVEVLKAFGNLDWSDDWSEEQWSDVQSWPTAVGLFEGRLWWFGGVEMFGSVADDYENWDGTIEGDSAPIMRTLGRGPVDAINYALPMARLIIGTAGSEIGIHGSTLDEPLTPTNAQAKGISNVGSAQMRDRQSRHLRQPRGAARLHPLLRCPGR